MGNEGGKILYPWDTPPEAGKAIEIADGVLWLRLPLPMALDHVNIYALDDGDGWTLVDTGMKWGKVQGIWEDLLAGPLSGKPVHRIMSTHHHPDHIGFNGWFMDRVGSELWSTQAAYLMGRMLVLDQQDSYTETQIDFYRRAGMSAEILNKRQSERPFNFADIVHPLPLGFQRLEDGQVVTMAGRRWDVRIGHGHAPHQATFWSQDDHLVLSGDQILPSISPNIGVYPTEPDANPLKEWLDSCERLATFARPDHLVLGGHKLPFTGLPFRMDQLIENHHGALSRMRKSLTTPKRASDLFLDIFKREISGDAYGLALVEALAHCNYLWHAGEVSRELRPCGAYHFALKA